MAAKRNLSSPSLLRKHIVGSDDPGVTVMGGTYKECKEALAETVRNNNHLPVEWGPDGDSAVLSQPDELGGDVFDTTLRTRTATKQVRFYVEPAPVGSASLELIGPRTVTRVRASSTRPIGSGSLGREVFDRARAGVDGNGGYLHTVVSALAFGLLATGTTGVWSVIVSMVAFAGLILTIIRGR